RVRQLGHKEADDGVEAGEDHVPRRDRLETSVAYVGHARGPGLLGRTVVQDTHGRALEPEPHRLAGLVGLTVAYARPHDRLHVLRAGDRSRYEPAHQQPRDRRAAVREVEVVARLVEGQVVL